MSQAIFAGSDGSRTRPEVRFQQELIHQDSRRTDFQSVRRGGTAASAMAAGRLFNPSQTRRIENPSYKRSTRIALHQELALNPNGVFPLATCQAVRQAPAWPNVFGVATLVPSHRAFSTAHLETAPVCLPATVLVPWQPAPPHA